MANTVKLYIQYIKGVDLILIGLLIKEHPNNPNLTWDSRGGPRAVGFLEL